MSEVNQELNELEKKSKEILIELIEDQKHEIELLEERNKRLFAFKENAGHGLVSINVYKDKLEEIKELKEEIENLANINIKAQNIIAELKAQNEKMKCCYNCKHGRIYFVEEIIVDCLANKVNSNNKFNNCDKWELAE